jgi:hypothetical protein
MSSEKNSKPNIAPLQPPTLATFRSWGSSAGAGRAGLPGGKDRRYLQLTMLLLNFLRLKFNTQRNKIFGGV